MPTNKRKKSKPRRFSPSVTHHCFLCGSGFNLISSYLIILLKKQAGISRLLALLALCAALILRVFALGIFGLEGRKREEVTDATAHGIPHGKRLIHIPCQNTDPRLYVVMQL